MVFVDNIAKGHVVYEMRHLSSNSSLPVNGEIICKLAYANFERRKEERKKLDDIKKQMDNIVGQNNYMCFYEAIAKENPEMEVLLNQYKEITRLSDNI